MNEPGAHRTEIAGLTSEPVAGGLLYFVAGNSTDYGWKLTPAHPALLWTNTEYQILQNCAEIRFQDISVSVDDVGQITTRYVEHQTGADSEPEIENVDPLDQPNGQLKISQTGATHIDARDFYKNPVGDDFFISKAWARNGSVDILDGGILAYRPNSSTRDEVTFVLHDGHWNTEILKVVVEDSEAIVEVGSQLIPSQLDEIGADVNLDVGSFITDHLLDDKSIVQVNGLPPGLIYDSTRMRIEGTISEDVIAGQPYRVSVVIHTSDRQIISTSFEWTVRDVGAVDQSKNGALIVPVLNNSDDAAGAAVLFTVASSAILAARSFSLGRHEEYSGGRGASTTAPSELAGLSRLTSRDDGLSAKGSAADDLLNLRLNDVRLKKQEVGDETLIEPELQEIDPVAYGTSKNGDLVPESANQQAVDLEPDQVETPGDGGGGSGGGPATDGRPFLGGVQSPTIAEDTLIAGIDVLAAAYDPEDDVLRVVSATAVNGIVVIGADDTLSYTPNSDFNGLDVIQYTVSDPGGNQVSSQVNINVTPVNDLPIAGVIGPRSVAEDGSITIDVLATATDVDGDALVVVSADAANGVLTINGDGTITFDPDADFAGVDTINYMIDDGNGGIVSSSIGLTVTPVNDVPLAQSDGGIVDEDGTITIDVLANDTDPDSALDPASVQLSGTAAPGDALDVAGQGRWTVDTTTGFITFTPLPDYAGPVSDVSYVVSDMEGAVSAPTIVSVSITPVNDSPIAQNDTALGSEDSALIFNVLANDSDIDNALDPATIQLSGTGSAGAPLVIGGEGTWTIDTIAGTVSFTPEPDFNGSITPVIYSVRDVAGAVSTLATLSGTLTPLNDAPSPGAPPPAATNEDTASAPIDILTSATDVDGDVVSLDPSAPPSAANGSVGVNPDGTLSYVPNADFFGSDTITYTINDGNGATATGSVSVTVSPQNDAPVAGIHGPVSTDEDTALSSIDVLSSASDIDGDVLTVNTANAANGSVTINPDGTLNYVPDADYNGPDTISYVISDGNGGSAAGSMDVNVVDVNDAPLAASLSDTAVEDTSVSFDVVANASDMDGSINPGSISIVGASGPGTSHVTPGEGTWSINAATGVITFTPEPDYDGPVTDITYTVEDDDGAVSAPSSLSVVITPSNDVPVAGDDNATGLEDNALVFDVLANDNDFDGALDPASVQIGGTLSAGDPLAVAGEGRWTVNTTSGEITFTPVANFNGAVSPITYTVRDDLGAISNPATLTGGLMATNDAPDPRAPAAGLTAEDTILGSFDVLSAASDVDGDALTVVFANAADGTVTINPDYSLNYVPTADYNGTDTITYTIDDGNGGQSTNTVSVVVNPVNDDPDAGSPPLASGTEDMVVASIDVLSGASDIDGDTLTVTGPAATFGTVTINPDGTLRYAPDPDFNGLDTITYTIDDGNGGTDPGSVLVFINSVNDAPTVVNDGGTVNEDSSVIIDVLSNDDDIDGSLVPGTVQIGGTTNAGDPLIVAGEGTWTINAGTGQITFTPEPDYEGTVTDISYTVEDNSGARSAPATVSVTLVRVNDAPTAVIDGGVTNEDTAIIIDVLANDTDIDGAFVPASVQIGGTAAAGDPLVMPGEGVWTVNTATGEITFTPEPDYDGPVTDITYTVEDNDGTVSTAATVSVTINNVNDSPVSVADNGTTTEDNAVVIDVLSNDSDVDGTLVPGTVRIGGTANDGDPLAMPGEGTWSVNTGTGQITFTPEPNYAGAVTDITYTVEDNVGAVSAPVTVSVTITGINDAPVSIDDADTVVEDNAVTIDVLGNDTDSDGTLVPASVQIGGTANAGDPLVVAGEGTWTINTATGAITFTPEPDYNGPVTDITYTVEDNDGDVSNAATVSATISDVNDAPVATDDARNTDEDNAVVIDVLGNDSDIDGILNPATVRIGGTAAAGDPLLVAGEGTWTVNTTTGAITFTPEANYNGLVTDITYTVEDDDGDASNAATVSVTLNPVNDAPSLDLDQSGVGVGYATTFTEGDPILSLADTDVLAVDQEDRIASITMTIDALPDGVAERFTINGSSFSLGTDNSGIRPMGAFDVNYTYTAATRELVITDASGPGTLTAAQVTQVLDTLSYRNASESPDESNRVFRFVLEDDGGLLSPEAVTSVTVFGVNDAPVAVLDADTTDEDMTVVIDVLANDGDVDGTLDPATVQIGGTASAGDPLVVAGEGTWTVNTTTGAITFTPVAGYNGSVTDITYTVLDDDGDVSNAVTVSVSITDVNDAPVAVLDGDTTDEDMAVVIDVLANDSDSDGTLDPATVRIGGTAAAGDPLVVAGEGTWSINTTNGAITFTPEPDYNGPVTDITYTVEDDDGDVSNAAAVSVVINNVNDDPTTTAPAAQSTDEDVPLASIDVIGSASDVDGDTLNVQAGSVSALNGTVTINGDDTLRYVPDADYSGADTISYTIEDGNGGTVAGSVAVTVNPVNDQSLLDVSDLQNEARNGAFVTTFASDWANWTESGNFNPGGAGFSAPVVTDNSNGTEGTITQSGLSGLQTGPGSAGAAIVRFDLGWNNNSGGTGGASQDLSLSIGGVVYAVVATPNGTGASASVSFLNGATGTPATITESAFQNWTYEAVEVHLPATVLDTGDLQFSWNNYAGVSLFNDDISIDNVQIIRAADDLTDTGATIAYENGFAAINLVDATASLSDVDDTNMEGARFTLTNPQAGDTFVVGGSALAIGNSTVIAGITYSVVSAAGETILNLTGTDTNANYLAALQGVQFFSSTGSPSTVDRIIEAQTFDGDDYSDVAMITLDISSTVAPPSAVGNNDSVAEDNPVSISVLLNDTAGDNPIDPASIMFDTPTGLAASYTVVGEGVWTHAAGMVTFTPEANFNGVATTVFYSVADTLGYRSALAPVDVTVSPVNDAPTIGNGNLAAVNEDDANPPGATVNSLIGASFNDIDAGSSFTGVVVTSNNAPVTQGAWQYSTDGAANWYDVGTVGMTGLALSVSTLVRFLPAANYDGVVDLISIRGMDDSYAGPFTSGVTRELVDTSSAGGTSPISSSLTSISTSITSMNDAPLTITDGDSTDEDTAVVIDVLANDSDVDGTLSPATVRIGGTASAGDPLVVPGEGTWSVNTTTGAITFTPEADYNGPVTDITYTVEDDDGDVSNAVAVSVTINDVNDAPVAVGIGGTADEGDPNEFLVVFNGTDIDGTIDPTTVQIAGTTNPGDSLVVAGQGIWSVDTVAGSITFTPETDYDGAVTPISYTFRDDDGALSNSAAAIHTIMPVNDAPERILGEESAGYAINMDGNNGAYLAAANADDYLGGLTELTIETQFSAHPTSLTDKLPIFSYYTAGNLSDELEITILDVNGEPRLLIEVGESELVLPVSIFDASTLLDSNQHTVSVSWENTAGSYSIYIDGALVHTGSGRAVGHAIDGNGMLVFGQEQDSVDGGYSTGEVFSGILHDVRIFDGVRTPAEIAAGSNVTLDPTEPGLLANWVFDIDNGASVEDVVNPGVNNLVLNQLTTGGFTASTSAEVLSVAENSVVGTVVATLMTSDVDTGDTFTYSLTSDPSGYFAIVGDELQVAAGAVLDFESNTNFPITLEVMDSDGLTRSANVEVFVTDVAEATTFGGGAAIIWTDSGTSETFVNADSGDDQLTGAFGDDTIYGGSGDDVLTGRSGDDFLDGGSGSDTLIGGAGADVIDGGSGTDTVTYASASEGVDVLFENTDAGGLNGAYVSSAAGGQTGEAEGDTYTSIETVIGSNFDDRIYGFATGMTVDLGTGDDTYDNDDISTGIDVVDGGAGDDIIATGGGDDDITGGAGNDTIDGGAGNDTLIVSGARADFNLHDNQDGTYVLTDLRVGAPDGVDTLTNIETIDYTDTNRSVAGDADATSPIAFDLNEDGQINVTGETTAQDKSGISAVGDTVDFDMNGDGDLETIEWLDGTGDALLVDNRDGMASTDMNGTRLFGDQDGTFEHGYQQLAELDLNTDQVVSGEELEGLELWVDDGDAKVDEGELFTLDEMGVVEISLELDESATDGEGRNLFQSSATRADGSSIMTEDVWFAEVQFEADEDIIRPQPIVQQPLVELMA